MHQPTDPSLEREKGGGEVGQRRELAGGVKGREKEAGGKKLFYKTPLAKGAALEGFTFPLELCPRLGGGVHNPLFLVLLGISEIGSYLF